MLEDDFNDILGKSIRGLNLSASQLGFSQDRLSSLLSGDMHEESIRLIAPLLNLNAQHLIQLEHYSPTAVGLKSLHTFTSLFGHLGVNAFIVETPTHLLIFDTGTNSDELLSFISLHPEKTPLLFITHGHPDHTAGTHRFKQLGIEVIHPEAAKNNQFDNITMTCLDVAGHCSPATAYLLQSDSLESPICIVGDAIFAGSIGGCKSKTAYLTALSNIRENILTLPSETLLCPGHGPLTTVRQELENNPFF